MKFTDRYLKSLEPAAKRYTKTEDGGLAIRVNPSGKKSWYFYYKADGKPRWLNLGTYMEAGASKPTMTLSAARDALAAAKTQRASGVDPAEAKAEAKRSAKLDPTLAEFAEEYLQGHARPNKKTWAKDQRQLEKNVLPHIGSKKLNELGRKDIVRALNPLKEAGKPVEHNRTLAVVRKMLNYAVGVGALEASPATHIPQMKEDSRERVLSREEIRALFTELDGINLWPATRDALELILRTAQRPGEVRNMEWVEVDQERGQWIIPAQKTKNGEQQVVPLTAKTLEVLDRAAGLAGGSRWVFPASRGSTPIGEGTMSQAMKRAINPAERPGKDADPEAEPIMERATPHDLRRTAATLITELGFNRLVMDKLLNHKDQTVGGVYDRHSYDKEKRQALEAWEEDLAVTFSQRYTDSNVASLPELY